MLEKFHAMCNKGNCKGVRFSDPTEVKRHMVDVHEVRPITPGSPLKVNRPTPTRPAVRPEKQQVTPGTEFTHRGYRFQVIGHTSTKYVALLLWTPGEDPGDKNAQLISTDPDGQRMYRLAAPTDKVVEAIAKHG